MKVSREKRAEHRAAIVGAASRLFRERGPEGVGVAEITKAAGLTHGGFYGHFASKDALLAEALTEALAGATERLESLGDGALARYANAYASYEHLSDPGGGCAIAALGSDVARQPVEVRAAFTAGVRRFLDGATRAADGDRADALARLSQLVGAMVMARAASGIDDELADELLAASRGSDRQS